jgi:hypothetical protein
MGATGGARRPCFSEAGIQAFLTEEMPTGSLKWFIQNFMTNRTQQFIRHRFKE